ncbi:MAG: 3-hydroxyacyl-CoA dehydrogenase family protein [Lachnospiraceae bacterium]
MSKKVLIIGAGTMGSAVAIVFATHDYQVTLVDQTEEVSLKAREKIYSNVSDMIERSYFEPAFLKKAEENIVYKGESSLEDLVPDFPLIVECVFEDAAVKKSLYQKIDPLLSPECIVCSNTSALNIFEIVELSRPENMLITHWFNPAYIMELVEVVRGPQTSDKTVEKVNAILSAIGKKPSVINQYIPGFIVNRLGAALMREASHMMEQGWVSAEDIDSAMALTCGIRYAFEGPIRLYDVVGWNIIQAGAAAMYPSLCNDTSNHLATELLAKGTLGVNSGKGVYDYSELIPSEYYRKRTDMIIEMQKYVNTYINNDN